MLKPVEITTAKRPLIHHPTGVLDAFCHYDATCQPWLDFDTSISHQIIELEFSNRRQIRVEKNLNRRVTR
jgi:hypothetical protein